MSGLVEFLWARYTEARDLEAGQRSIPDGLPFRWTAVYGKDDQHVLINDFHRVGMDEFMEKYGESAADPAAIADLDAKLAVLDLHARLDDLPFCATCDAPSGVPGRPDGCDTVRVLAVPCASHPDYREEWKP